MSGSNGSADDSGYIQLTPDNIIDVVERATLDGAKINIEVNSAEQMNICKIIEQINDKLFHSYISIIPCFGGTYYQHITISFYNGGVIRLLDYALKDFGAYKVRTWFSAEDIDNKIEEWRAEKFSSTEIIEVPDELDAYLNTLIHKE